MVAEPWLLLHGRARPWSSRGTLESRLVVWWSGELRVESVERGAPGDAGVKTVKRERAKQSDSDCSPSSGSESNVGNLCRYESWARREAPRANRPCRLQRSRWQWPSSSRTCNFSNFKSRWQRFSKQREMSLRNKFRMPRRPPHTKIRWYVRIGCSNWDHISEPWTSGTSWNLRRQKNRWRRDSTGRSARRCTTYSWWWRHWTCVAMQVWTRCSQGRGSSWENGSQGLLDSWGTCCLADAKTTYRHSYPRLWSTTSWWMWMCWEWRTGELKLVSSGKA